VVEEDARLALRHPSEARAIEDAAIEIRPTADADGVE
jgi:hypothetical protein